jgi:hypothetical protein
MYHAISFKSVSVRHDTQAGKIPSVCILKHSTIITESGIQKMTKSNVYELVISFQGTTVYKNIVTDTDWP